MTDGCQAYRPTAAQRLWRALGFRTPFVPYPDQEDGFVEGRMLITAVSELDWADRLRVLLSGKVQHSCSVQTDILVGRAKTTVRFGVLPPGGRHG